ncbi:MAG: MnhB domain-containing protein, partial [Calditrichia bacterium]
MGSVILQTATRYLSPLMIIVSLIIFYRGHNLPGGGFAGGLIAASAFILYYFAYGIETAAGKLRFDPLSYIAVGLLLVLGSGLLSLFTGDPFLTGKWLSFHILLLGKLH